MSERFEPKDGSMLKRFEDLADLISVRNASIRTKVTLALVGVLLLILPQIVLTVAYMVRFFEGGEHVVRLSEASEALQVAAGSVFDYIHKPLPEDDEAFALSQGAGKAASEAIDGAIQTLESPAAGHESIAAIRKRVVGLRTLLTEHRETLDKNYQTLKGLIPAMKMLTTLPLVQAEIEDANNLWLLERDSANRKRLEERIEALEKLAVALPIRLTKAHTADERRREQMKKLWRDARAELLSKADVITERFIALKKEVAVSAKDAGREIHQKVDDANRWLITLVLLTMVYIAVVILLLPSKLVRPLKHFSSVMDRAGSGQLQVRARVVGGDEMARLGGTLNHMLDQIITFDELKRNRIYEDQARIRTLGEIIPTPIAFFDTHLRLEYANAAFRSLFKLGEGYEDTHAGKLIEGDGARTFVSTLDGVLRRRRPVSGLPLKLQGHEGDSDLRLSVGTGRNRAGKISYLLVRIQG